MKIKKCAFTLLEILTVLFILSFVVSLTAVKVRQLFKQQQVLSELKQVANLLTMAQDLMLILNNDVEVTFNLNSKSRLIEASINVAKMMPLKWDKIVEKPVAFRSFKAIKINSESSLPLKLKFIDGSMSRASLQIDLKDDYAQQFKNYTFLLPGYPAVINYKTGTRF